MTEEDLPNFECWMAQMVDWHLRGLEGHNYPLGRRYRQQDPKI